MANALRLLKLAPELQVYLREGKISVGHAKVILGLENAAQQKLAVERILKNSLNVRQTEQLVFALQNDSGNLKSSKNKNPVSLDAHVVDLENKLQEHFGTKVHLRYRQGKGALEIKFFNEDDLERILKIAGISLD
ncbi:MAG: ParB/RepB/Spo0J family partition protein [Limisphaerales bacterium]